jgi:hypothetical protein
MRQLVFLGLGFLNTDDICVGFVQPFVEAFFRGGTNAIGIYRDYTHVCLMI